MRVAVLCFDDPWASSHGGAQRARLFLESLDSLGHEPVCIYPADPSRSSDTWVPSDRIERVGVAVTAVGTEPRLSRLADLKRRYLPLPTIRGGRIAALATALRRHGPYDVLLTQQLRGVQYLQHTPGAALWLDQTDVWSRFLEVEIATMSGLPKLTARAQRLNCLREEKKAARVAGVITAAGYGDLTAFEAATGKSVDWLPPAVVELTKTVERSPNARPTAGLLGNFKYWPNIDAYNVLRDFWLPKLKQEGWNVIVAGYGSEELPPIAGVQNLGQLNDPSTFYELVDVTLAPLRLGAGIKVKVLESLFAGRPVIASEAALEGFPPGSVPGAYSVPVEDPLMPSPADVAGLKELAGQDIVFRSSRAGFRHSIKMAMDALEARST